MRSVLITGATGFFGSHIAEVLLNHNYQVAAYYRESSDFWRVSAIRSSINWFNINSELSRPFESKSGISHIIHAATNYGRNSELNSALIETNLLFPLKLLELANQYNAKTFFNTDTALPKTVNAYSLSKHQFSEWLKKSASNTKIFNIKLEHIYGPKDDNTKFVTYIINECLRNIDCINLTRGEQKRDFIYVTDAANAYLSLLENYQRINDNYCELELGSGEGIRIKKLVELIHELTNSSSILKFGALPYRENESMESVANCIILNKIGWKTKHNLIQGLMELINYEKKKI
ncbi:MULTISPECIES: NAD-dependent epimerase/dehydratase family protein [Methylomonas]|uniref:NAD-dependent epimerase/dehydratase family protein n=1 Tax=Methylomonas TaxID=416 RepID=UPI001231A772|nr:NAD-dependent epimerase/dehydratase family protein [Methylomonas rhizoryzae]